MTAARIRRHARELELRRMRFEAAVLQKINLGVTHQQTANDLGASLDRVRAVVRRLRAEGIVGQPRNGLQDPYDVRPQQHDEAARSELRRWGVVYPNAKEAGVDNVVAAMRNGASARAPVYGGSVAGSCADIGQPVR